MALSIETWLALPAGYVLGSIPFGLILAKVLGGKDVRQHGSGNIGATNVSRVAGPLAGVLTLLLDAGKGAAAVMLSARFTGQNATAMMVAGLAALAGHCFSVWLGLKGGKGVATGLGVFAALCPLAAVSGFVVFVLVFLSWRYVSLASVVAAAVLPVCTYLLYAPGTRHAPPLSVSLSTALVSTLIIVKHRENLRRLLAGSENRLKFGGR